MCLQVVHGLDSMWPPAQGIDVLTLVSALYLSSPLTAELLLTHIVLAVVLENLYPMLGLPIKVYELRGIFSLDFQRTESLLTTHSDRIHGESSTTGTPPV